jgi:hypothetical protein
MQNWCSEWCRNNIFNINGVVNGVAIKSNGVVKSPIQTREYSDNK